MRWEGLVIGALLSLVLVGCEPAPDTQGAADEAVSDREAKGPPRGQEGFEDRDQGQRHPPLPADNPIWDWDAEGFVPDFGWYGEHSWADVRMRVAGHLATAARDQARVHAEGGAYRTAAESHDALVAMLEGLDVAGSQVATQINGLLIDASRRDAALLRALAEGRPPPVPESGLAAARARYLGLALSVEQGADPSALQAELENLTVALRTLGEPRSDLDLRGFDDFNDRHALRVRLFEAALDSADPLGLDERWGYWESVEVARQVAVLDQAVQALRGDVPPTLSGIVATRWPSALAERERSDDQAPRFTAEGLGWLPTGDSLIDVGAEPGPMAIGTLEKLGLDDADHAAFLATQAKVLNGLLASDPSAVPDQVRALTERFDALGHGSRYYNIKQARSEAVRQLARAGEPLLALAVLRENRPLHHQDWACPNREGILLALEGRLLAEAGQVDDGLAFLARSISAGLAFLADVDAAEASGPRGGPGRSPPQMGNGPSGPQGPGGPSGHGPPGRPGHGPPPRPPNQGPPK